MPVFKIEKNNNFTIMSNYHFKDMNLSYSAKGLLSFMLTLPEDWDYSINGLVKISKEGTKAIRSILKELESKGYLIRNKITKSNGRFDYEYLIYEQPYTPLGHAVEGHALRDTQINTKEQNTKEQIDKDDKTNCHLFFNEEEHNHLTLELIKGGYIEKNDSQIHYYDNLFNKLLDEGNSYKELMTILHYIIPRVVNRNFRDEELNPIINKFGYIKNAIISNIELFNNDIEELYTDSDLELYESLIAKNKTNDLGR